MKNSRKNFNTLSGLTSPRDKRLHVETKRIKARRVLQGILFAASLMAPILGFCPSVADAQPTLISQNAWAVLTADPKFSDAVELFKYAGLTQYIQNDQFTAFIPTNAAFDKNPEVLPMLLRGHNRAFPDTTAAVQFIRAHAIYDQHPISEFSGRQVTLTSISGSPISIDGLQPSSYLVTWVSVQSKTATAHVVDKPIISSNALIYPVDTVILTSP